jgi:hypothetical protein
MPLEEPPPYAVRRFRRAPGRSRALDEDRASAAKASEALDALSDGRRDRAHHDWLVVTAEVDPLCAVVVWAEVV